MYLDIFTDKMLYSYILDRGDSKAMEYGPVVFGKIFSGLGIEMIIDFFQAVEK